MKIILIAGKALSGKDTVANILKDKLRAKGEILICHYADLVKYICSQFFDWDGKKDKEGRTLLQYVGTDVVRTKEPDFWFNFIINVLEFFPEHWDYVIIPDCRFYNEMQWDRKIWDVIKVKVERLNFQSPLTKEQQEHPSETGLDLYADFDYIISAESGIYNLEKEVDIFFNKYFK